MENKKFNVLLLTLDDEAWNSKDFLLSNKEELCPNMDSFVSDSLYFKNSHVAIALCQPSRSVLLTGRYPHHNGARGFEDIAKGIPTLSGILHDNGYHTSIIGKENHVSPREAFKWDDYIQTYNPEKGWGRDPEVYREETKKVLEKAKEEGKPFFLMANSHDPHRPFAGSKDEITFFGKNLQYFKEYSKADVVVPPFLPELEDVKEELSQYLQSVNRADNTVGAILDTLKEYGVYDDTIILLLSDNGASLPFCKANCYLNSTSSPFAFRVPGYKKGETDALVSSIDYMPTILSLLGIEYPAGMDGKSLVHILKNPQEEQYDDLYTFFFKTAHNEVTKRELYFPMRAVVNKDYVYIYNAWSDGETEYRTETMVGLTFDAMKKAGKDNIEIQSRVNMYLYREKEELYSIKADPNGLHNLVDKEGELLMHFRKRMLSYMKDTSDEQYEGYKVYLEKK